LRSAGPQRTEHSARADRTARVLAKARTPGHPQVLACDDDDGDAAALRVALLTFRKLEPVHIRHHKVEHPAKTHAEDLSMLDDAKISAYFADRSILVILMMSSKIPQTWRWPTSI
jgi:hypothetical protein